MSNDIQPEIRFPGFTEDWEERRLKQLGEIQTGNTPPTNDTENYNKNGIMWVTPTDINNLVISDTAKKLSEIGRLKARIAMKGSILVTCIASIGKNTLALSDVGFNQQINALTPNKEFDSYFLLSQSGKWSEKMKILAGRGTMQIVNKTDFSNITTYVPKYREQVKIGHFFKQLDDTIMLQQRKLDLLKETKKGFLQKMFPENGAKVPEIRFPGFTEDWEQRKFKEFSKKTGKKNTKDLDFPAYSVSNKAGLISQTEQFDGSRLDDLEKTNYKFVEPNEFAYNPARVNVGSIAFNNLGMTVIVSSLYVVVKMSEDLDNEFILQFIKSPTFIKEVKRNTEGSVREYLFYENFANIKFPFTRNKEEQQKIGAFFKQLDDTIALHQRKLDLLKETKKGFLQKMFV
ncbi:restriction endonuclease subunit S [Enterococcus faecium]|uniref:restriction endonuclease subunit S n=1 Tax=Enterococcus faecium TaxID=1352 RepID=UPI001E55C262|nr:restriction endonuclease subunit S [Enterococcus faecium]MCD5100147.1 restriction endonuclease subunit S [Enterococcus faecium]